MTRCLVAPLDLAEKVIALIDREAEHARQGRPARIIAKMNALLDKNMIQALYRASQAGVEIDLIVRGICALRPGVRGVSDRIRVRSIVGRFLEHSRIYYFATAARKKFTSAAPTGCRAIFTSGSKCWFRCATNSCASAYIAKFSTPIWRITARPASCCAMPPTFGPGSRTRQT